VAGGYRFSVLVGTIFENTNKPLRNWFRVIHMMLTSKKGVSALQMKRVMICQSKERAFKQALALSRSRAMDTSCTQSKLATRQ
jgi:hypothetical protein